MAPLETLLVISSDQPGVVVGHDTLKKGSKNQVEITHPAFFYQCLMNMTYSSALITRIYCAGRY
jgi:hypothetical protein